MNMNKGNEEAMVINLKDLASLFMKRVWIILLVALIVGTSCLIWTANTYEERYTSTVEAILFSEEANKSFSATAAYIQIAESMIGSCEFVFKSDETVASVLKDLQEGDAEALASLGLKEEDISRRVRELIKPMKTAAFKNAISISPVEGSYGLRISVTTSDPEVSQLLANALCTRGSAKMDEIFGSEPITVISEGRRPTSPSNSVNYVLPLAAAVLAGLLVYAIFLIISVSDNKINRAEDVEKYLDLSVLGEIPVVITNPKKNKKYY